MISYDIDGKSFPTEATPMSFPIAQGKFTIENDGHEKVIYLNLSLRGLFVSISFIIYLSFFLASPILGAIS